MAVPEFYQFFRPVLSVLADGMERHQRDIAEAIADKFQLSPEDREESIPSGGTRYYNRVQWALTYLRQAKLLENVSRGVNRITPRGMEYLASCPEVIKPVDLEQFPEFVEFQKRSRSGKNGDQPSISKVTLDSQVVDDRVTPEEEIATAFNALNAALAQDLIDRVKAMPPAYFEKLIVKLMLRLGYGGASDEAGQHLGKSGDGGVDGVISQDKLGLDKVYLQAKRYADKAVGREEVQAFAGALAGQRATKGVFITTSTFSTQARDYAEHNANFKISRLMCSLGAYPGIRSTGPAPVAA